MLPPAMLSNHVSFKPGPFLKHGMGSSFLENKQILGHPARPNGHPPDGPRLLGAGLARPLVTFQNSSSPVANSSRTAVLCCLPLSQHPGYTCEGLNNTGHLQYPPNSTRAGRVRPLTTQLPGSRSTRQCCKGLSHLKLARSPPSKPGRNKPSICPPLLLANAKGLCSRTFSTSWACIPLVPLQCGRGSQGSPLGVATSGGYRAACSACWTGLGLGPCEGLTGGHSHLPGFRFTARAGTLAFRICSEGCACQTALNKSC